MKTKIYLGIFSLVMGLLIASCSDDNDYKINTTPILNESSVVTGSSDVTATTAILHGSVEGLDGMASSSYSTGFLYGSSQESLTESVSASLNEGSFSATLTGLANNSALYYQAYVLLQGKVYYKGEIKSLITTNATVTTQSASAIDYASALLGGALTNAPSDATCGIVISTFSDVEAVRSGLVVKNAALDNNFTLEREGLLPNTHYYYAAYLNLGLGVVYGEVKDFTTANYDFDLDNDLVDLGLSVKWARFNIGANSNTGLGGLFGFGDLTGCSPSMDPADYASANTYRTASDLAYQAFNGRATLPTAADFEELFALCAAEWTEIDGVTGYKLTGPSKESIFLPAAGSRISSDVAGEGTEGYYLTGTVNPSNSKFAISYQFNANMNTKTTAAVYQAMSVRAVSTAKNVAFDRTLLYGKWYLDNGQDGEQHVFEGPFTQWGSSDNWGTVSNGQPNIEQQIHWEMGTGNGWIGYTYGVDYGYMEFLEDGTVEIHRLTDDGVATDEKGKYTIDEKNKVIDISIDVLSANTWIATKKGQLKILSLTSDGLQIALPDGDYGYSTNYYSQRKAEADAKIEVALLCVGGDWNGTWGSPIENLAPTDLEGQHTSKYEGACSSAMVFTLDFKELIARYPNAFVRIDDMKCDGKSIKFDANHFFYGDIENNGTYRIELFNIWGKGAENGLVKNSPFSNSQNVGTDENFKFNNSLEFTYTILLNGNGAGTYTPSLVTVNPSWTSLWGYNKGAELTVKYEDFQYSLVNTSFDIKYDAADYADGSIMTFIEVPDIYGYFPTMHATLDEFYLDGKKITFDASKVLDANESPKYRLELWNCYGNTKQLGSAFGTPEGDVMKSLAFTSSMQAKFTFHSLFAVPQW